MTGRDRKKSARRKGTPTGDGPGKLENRPDRSIHPEEEVEAREPAAHPRRPHWQDWTGLGLIFGSLAGIAAVGLWFGNDEPLRGLGFWAGRAAIQGISAGLIALFVWALLARRWTVSYTLVLGVLAVGLLLYDATIAWRIDRERMQASHILSNIEQGHRNIEDLSASERENPYIDAWLIMRDLYWELNAMAGDRMSGYRAAYEDYTENGGFLDIARLRNEFDLWYSLVQIQDLEAQLTRIETKAMDTSDMRWSLKLLKVDPVTRSNYEDDLNAALEVIERAQAETIARERRTLRLMRNALEVLVDADGRYRIDGDRVIFENPDDAAKFSGKGS